NGATVASDDHSFAVECAVNQLGKLVLCFHDAVFTHCGAGAQFPHPRICAARSAIASGWVTGNEHRSPTQMKAALSFDALILSCAGCEAGSVSDARITMRSRNGS